MTGVKEQELKRAIDIVSECCSHGIGDGGAVTPSLLLGRVRTENAVMTRCVLIQTLVCLGYSTTTIAQTLRRSAPAVRHLMRRSRALRRSSRAYRLIEDEAIQRLTGK